MKNSNIIFNILKYLFDNQLNGRAITLSYKLRFIGGIKKKIHYLLSEGYIEEDDYFPNEKKSFFNRRYRLTELGDKYLQEQFQFYLGSKTIRANYFKNTFLGLIFSSVLLDGAANFHLFDKENKSEHIHNEEVVKVTLNHFNNENTTDTIQLEFKNIKNTIDFLNAYWKDEKNQNRGQVPASVVQSSKSHSPLGQRK
jgi:hypothetical protein